MNSVTPPLPVSPSLGGGLKHGLRDILKFEIHLSHACNLSCESCSHYSNYHFSGSLTLGQAEEWYLAWSPRIRPARITVLGGEPAFNRDLCEHLKLLRRYWPDARIWLVSNGFLLHRHPELPRTLAQIGNYRFQISRHHNDETYTRAFAEVLSLLQRWQEEVPGFQCFVKHSFADWSQRYREENGLAVPFADGNPAESWRICRGKACVQLHEGFLWKCPALAYLSLLQKKGKMGLGWEPYLNYRPLRPDCSDAELATFFERAEEPFCGMCPAHERIIQKRNPMPVAGARPSLAV